MCPEGHSLLTSALNTLVRAGGVHGAAFPPCPAQGKPSHPVPIPSPHGPPPYVDTHLTFAHWPCIMKIALNSLINSGEFS